MKLRGTLLGLLLLLLAPAFAADTYPSRPVRLIIPFAPGGAADMIGRIVSENLARELGGKPIVIVNREGAGTIIGVETAAKATPDGYTLLLSGDAATINAAAGIKALHVPYRGIAPAMASLQGAQVDYAIVGSSAAVPAVKGGQLKALAVTSRTRSEALPQVPTLVEQGVQAETGSW